MEQQTFHVKGMHCASCSSIITKKIGKLPGVESCDVNFATEKAKISFDTNEITVDRMNDEIEKLGYKLSKSSSHQAMNHAPSAPTNHSQSQKMEGKHEDHSAHLGLDLTKEEKLKELESLKNKINFSLPLTLLIFILMMWDISSQLTSFVPSLPIPMQFFNQISFIVATIFLFWIGKPYLEAVIRFIKYRVSNMDSLVGIGTLTAYFYSSTLLLFPPVKSLLSLPDFLYFDVTIVVIGFITLGKYLEARSKLKTGSAIEKLLNLQAKTALVIRNGQEVEIPVAEVVVGDIVIVKPGSKIPVDGVIAEGTTSIDESMINGEPLPQDKKVGDIVIGSTINKQGSIRIKASKVGADTMLAQIVAMVEEAQGSKAQIQNLADKISSIFIPTVLFIAIATFFAWILLGTLFLGFSSAFSFALLSFVGILVIACPCALGLATPTAIIVGVGKGAENGILIKNAQSLEKLKNVDTIVFDKTGTLTIGKPSVTDILPIQKETSETELLKFAASLENHSQHPLASAIIEEAKAKKLDLMSVVNFKENEGVGVEGKIEGENFIVRKPHQSEKIEKIDQLQNQGKTVVVIERNGKTIGALAISDTIKPKVKDVISDLKHLRLKTVMITGDSTKAANHIAKIVGIDEVKSEVLPQDKSNIIKSLQLEGKVVAMIGDGINDAPALSQANVGIAMATGTDIAIESSDITLLGGDLTKVKMAIRLSRTTIRTIKQNLFWAFIYNIIGIPLAAGVFYPLLGIFLNPIFAGLAMGLSSVSVVSNSLLLRRVKL